VIRKATFDFGDTQRGLISLRLTNAALCSMFKTWQVCGNEASQNFAKYVLQNASNAAYFKRGVWTKDWIEEVPLPRTAQQMALTGNLFRLCNFKFLKPLGSGTFSLVMMSEIVRENDKQSEEKRTAENLVAAKLEFVSLKNVQQSLVDPLVQGTRVTHDGIAEILAIFPVHVNFHQPEGKSENNSAGDWNDEDLEKSWVLFVTIMECGKSTLDDGFDIFFWKLDRARDQTARLNLLKEARSTVQRLLTIACALEEKAILHRDIKPTNVIRGEDDMLKLVDFRSTRQIQKLAIDLRTCGTPAYCSDHMDEYQDVHCIGKIGIHMLLGYSFSEMENNEEWKRTSLKENWGNLEAVRKFFDTLSKIKDKKTASQALQLVEETKDFF
jgi:hypothetical protein